MSSRDRRKRALSGRSGISPPKTRSKRSPKSDNKPSKEHLSEQVLEAKDIERDRKCIDNLVMAEAVEKDAPAEGEVHNESVTDFDGFTEDDLVDSGKVVSMLKSLLKDVKQVKDSNTEILAGQNSIKQNLAKIQADNEKLREDVNALKSTQKKTDSAVQKVRDDLNATQRKVKTVDDLVGRHEIVIKNQSDAIKKLQQAQPGSEFTKVEWAYSKTVVAQNVYMTDQEYFEGTEDVQRKAELIINSHLGLPGVTVVRALRKGVKEDYVGIIKIELASEEEAKTVLQNKKKLGDHPDSSVNSIFLRPSKPDGDRKQERNNREFMKIVDPTRSMLYMDEYGNVKPKGSGRGGFRGSRGANRGRGRGRGPRGARGRARGRGQYSDAVDYANTWSPSLAPPQRSAMARGRGRGRGGAEGNDSYPGSFSPASSVTNMLDTEPEAPPFSTFTQRANNNGPANPVSVTTEPTNQGHTPIQSQGGSGPRQTRGTQNVAGDASAATANPQTGEGGKSG